MVSIGNKKYRNLQEQVGYNTECIQELAKAIDGITLEDKLVIIANDSGTFTDEEMTVLNGPLAFISDGSKVWLKQSETASEFIFKAIDIVATEQGGTHYNVGGSKIVVTRATRAYVTSDDVIITTYSKTQIDTLLSAKASLSGANFTGAITAPSIIEGMSGYSFSKGDSSYHSLIYVGVVKTGNKVTFVVFTKYTHVTGKSGLYLGDFTIPSDIGSKLYPYTIGANESLLSADIVLAQTSQYGYGSSISGVCYKISNTQIRMNCFGIDGLTNGTEYFIRYEVTFLLGDNLAE